MAELGQEKVVGQKTFETEFGHSVKTGQIV